MDPLAFFAILGLALAALALFHGVVSMAHGGPEDMRMSTHWMFMRVSWQAIALLAIVLAVLRQL